MSEETDTKTLLNIPHAIRTGEWLHWAWVTGPGGMKLFLNGVLAGTNEDTGSFAAVRNNDENYLGRSVFRLMYPELNQDLAGQIDEFRAWKVQRTREQIRDNLHRHLTGTEPGLVGLWNFDDPANPGRDSSPGAHHGKLMGQAFVTNAVLPVIVFGKITDASGKLLARASIEVQRVDGVERRFTANAAGEYAFTLNPAERCDVFVSTGELSAYRLSFQLTAEPQQRLDWTLADPEKTPVVLGSAPFVVPASAGSASANPPRVESSTARPAEAGTTNAPQFPAGTVVATVLSDEQGNFKFPNLKPGLYQLRVQVPGGRAWLNGGRMIYAQPDLSDTERAKLASIVFRLAPFKKGRWKKFSALDGLLGNAVGGIIFTPDHMMWLGTQSGLSRFDGREFLNLTTEKGLPFTLSAPAAQHRDANGVFWLGTTVEGLLRYQPADRQPSALVPTAGLPTGHIVEIASTTDGAVWWRTEGALVRYDGERGTVFTNLWRKEEFSRHLAVAGDRLWLTGPGAGLVRFDGTNHIRFTRQQGLLSEDTGTVATAPDGTVWLAVGNSGMALFDGTNFSYLTQRDGLPAGVITRIHVALDGQVWLASAQRIVARFDGRSFTQFGNSDDLTGGQNSYAGGVCFDIQNDPEGVTWFATSDGLWRYEEKTITHFTTPDGLPAQTVNCLLAAPDGSLVASIGTNGVTWFDGQRF
ncbi:MAG: hypothetical protein HW378_4882, partial [Anaerolineales bacterium]|nr:hypothetical protein [Anaerolineales bacterium]